MLKQIPTSTMERKSKTERLHRRRRDDTEDIKGEEIRRKRM
jgi:hypothetical protein